MGHDRGPGRAQWPAGQQAAKEEVAIAGQAAGQGGLVVQHAAGIGQLVHVSHDSQVLAREDNPRNPRGPTAPLLRHEAGAPLVRATGLDPPVGWQDVSVAVRASRAPGE